jgi:hypothetical protein
MTQEQSIKILKELHEDFEAIRECCTKYYSVHIPLVREVYGKRPPQPKIAKYGFQEFSNDDCKKLYNGKLQIADYKPAPFVSKHTTPTKVICENPVKPYKPAFSPNVEGFFSIFLMCLFFGLACWMLAIIVGSYARIGVSNSELKKAEEQYNEILNLNTDGAYVEWQNIWDDSPTVSKLQDGWTSVSLSWAENGYPVSWDELNDIMNNAKEYNGTIRLSAVESLLFAYIREEKTTYDKNMVEFIGGYGGSFSNNVYNDSIKFGLGFAWFGFAAFGIIYIVIIIYRIKEWKGGLIALFGEIFIYYPHHRKSYRNELSRYRLESSHLKEKELKLQQDFEKGTKAYEQELAAERFNFEEEQEKIKNKYLADIALVLTHYKEEYQKYLNGQEAFENEQDRLLSEYEQNRDKVRAEANAAYNIIRDKIRANDNIPVKYREAVIDTIDEEQDISIEFVIGKGQSARVMAMPLQVDVYSNSTIYPLEKETAALLNIIRAGRADTIKEAINCYTTDKFNEERIDAIKEAEDERNRILEEQAEEELRLQEQQLSQQRQRDFEDRRFRQEQENRQRSTDRDRQREMEKQTEFQRKQADEARRQTDLLKQQQRDAERQVQEQAKKIDYTKCLTCARSSTCGRISCHYAPETR